MDLTLYREPSRGDCTIGSLLIEGQFFCFTCEDVVRVDDAKVDGQTAIPAGRYAVTIDRSQRFGRMLPRLLDVPGFTGIRIHPGNTALDTAGCILVGLARSDASVLSSQVAITQLLGRLAPAVAGGEPVWIRILNQPVPAMPVHDAARVV